MRTLNKKDLEKKIEAYHLIVNKPLTLHERTKQEAEFTLGVLQMYYKLRFGEDYKLK